jgi:retron-type reverse transcriptase
LSGLYKKAGKFQSDLKVDDIYKKFILDKSLYLVAYDKLKSKPPYRRSNMTSEGAAITPETLDGMSSEELDRIIELLRTEKFQFSTSRRVYIPKKDGSKRPLSIGSPRDKLVQEVMRMTLEAIFEPGFSNASHGFRPNRGCHSALRTIFSRFHGVWAIEGDFSKCFDTIDHHKLMGLIGRNVKDARFMALL